MIPDASTHPRVLVFDSGVGGLSVLAEIIKLTPEIEVVYASDNAAFPYGTKSEEELLPRIHSVINALIQSYAPSLVVIACNTASTLALSSLRNSFDLPFVGVVPAIKPAAEASQSKVIGLLATPATIRRAYTQELIHTYASNCEIIKVGSSWLVELAEKKLAGNLVDIEALTSILQPFAMAQELDQLVLACTHFPLLKNEIQSILPDVTLVDSGCAVARRVESLLHNNARDSLKDAPRTGVAVFTKPSKDSEALAASLATFGLLSTEYLTV